MRRARAVWLAPAALFLLLLALSWRRWASFDGDLNREWTTPARVAAGERLYRDVAFYYGPLAPELEGAAFRLFGARVGTAIGFGLAATLALLGSLLLFARRHLGTAPFLAAAAVAVGVFAFAPENGAFVACYSQSALLAVTFTWGALLAADARRPLLTGALAGLAVLSKSEALPALLGPLLLLPKGTRARGVAAAAVVAAAGYGIALAGIPPADLVTYGPLRHLDLPPAFRTLYLEIAGVAPHLLRRGLAGAFTGACLLLGWATLVSGLLARRAARALAGAAAAGAGLAVKLLVPMPEPLLSTCVRGTPVLLGVALVELARRWRAARDPGERHRLAALAASGIVAAGFLWRTVLWTVPVFAYAPLAAVSSVAAVAWALGELAPRETPRPALARALVLAPLLFAPLFFLPRLVEFYRAPRTEVVAPRGAWAPPGAQGALFSQLVAHLDRTGVRDRGLVCLPEAGALGFLLGVRSPMRMEQVIPGLFDERADAEAARRLEKARPDRIVLVDRDTREYGPERLGVDYARKLFAAIEAGWKTEAVYAATGPDGRARRARVLVRR